MGQFLGKVCMYLPGMYLERALERRRQERNWLPSECGLLNPSHPIHACPRSPALARQPEPWRLELLQSQATASIATAGPPHKSQAAAAAATARPRSIVPSPRCGPDVNGPLSSPGRPWHLHLLMPFRTLDADMYSIHPFPPLPARPKKVPYLITLLPAVPALLDLPRAGQPDNDR